MMGMQSNLANSSCIVCDNWQVPALYIRRHLKKYGAANASKMTRQVKQLHHTVVVIGHHHDFTMAVGKQKEKRALITNLLRQYRSVGAHAKTIVKLLFSFLINCSSLPS
jgi:homoserine acetyltransferase